MNETHKVPALWGWPSNARPEMGGVRKRMRPQQTLGDVINDAAEGRETEQGRGQQGGFSEETAFHGNFRNDKEPAGAGAGKIGRRQKFWQGQRPCSRSSGGARGPGQGLISLKGQ